ncbi:Uncharacterized protein YjcR [Paenibacillus tianmuensis]|uniref:Uncharacterized protein YjcR n=1 Tax=Paenibacillus tianmuensis TaxID=624147 RepID=A0A1G4TWY7_9BACL|nr:phage terminase small subunit [Paenibacillus tianmuensis]SCW85864.1 Uncharacterized protein YjcR [Paenibacillus tianmuensis]
MPRVRDPKRSEAEKLYLESFGQLDLVKIAEKLGISDGTVRGWKSKDKWDTKLNGTLQTKERSAPKDTERSKRGAPKGNKNALGNRGGVGGPLRNGKAVSHGLFRKFLPDDEETREIYDNVGQMDSLDLLWENIQIKFTAIIRAQKIMFVRDQDDRTEVLKRKKRTDTGWEDEFELQHAWDKQATFLQAQARAMTTLTSMIRQYEEMCRQGWADEEQKLRIEKLKAEVDNIKGGGKNQESENWADALMEVAERRRAKVSEGEWQ